MIPGPEDKARLWHAHPPRITPASPLPGTPPFRPHLPFCSPAVAGTAELQNAGARRAVAQRRPELSLRLWSAPRRRSADRNLSLLDICYSSCTIPQMLAHSFTGRPIISYGKCFAQMSITLFLAVTECFLLAVMAYDRFVAICSPLHYMLIMSRKVYVCLAVFSWTAALMLSVVPCFTLKFHLCGRNVINHFMCEVLAIIKLECSDTSGKVNLSSGTSAFTLLMPFAFILVTYGRIGLAVMRIKSVKGRSRALSTCGSHLAVVGIFYGSSLAMYMRPQTKSFSDQDKLGAVFYMVITPVLNPLIYSLRNKDVKGALWRVMGRKTLS
ncbi:olfactory receptor 13H1-like [Tiliqua scincoides]|uniref:olfactory receptor 13H1-like n=1 Tax=Tiliqua scincoides TaxID=71010 RepID=UPI0034618D24